MKRLVYQYQMDLKFSDFVKEQQFQLRCIPQDNYYQKVIETHYYVYPLDSINKFTDGFGNLVLAGNAIMRHRDFSFQVKGIVEVDYSSPQPDFCHPLYRYETPLTRVDSIEHPEEIYGLSFDEQMMKIMQMINDHMTYTQGTTTVQTSAQEALNQGTGVCQDYAHIMVGLCRKLGYPARYIAGMLYGEGETHAWVEVYNKDTWYSYDPTHNRKVDDNYIVLAHGRDYTDTIIDKGMFIGNCKQIQTVKVSVTEDTGR